MVVVEDDLSIKSLFYRGFRIYECRFREDCDETEIPGSLTDAERTMPLQELRQLFHRIAFFVERLSLFSPNEELQDINTSSLIFLLVPFILAELSSHAEVRENRLEHMESSMVYWKQFLAVGEALNLCSDLAKQRMQRSSDSINPSARRAEKIASYTEHKELDQQVRGLLHKKLKAGADPYQWGSEAVDEDLERSIITSLLKRSVLESLDHIALAEQELQFLRLARDGVNPQDGKTEAPKKPFIMTIKDPSDLRNLYRNKVFQPFHELPTITLAEVADWEMQVEVGQLGAEERMRNEAKKKEHSDSESDSTDDVNEFDEEKEYKDREWDNWKDANPKGMGNKNKNVG